MLGGELGGWPAYDAVEQLPKELHAVAIDCGHGDPGELLSRVREQVPEAFCLGFVDEGDASLAGTLLDCGFDDVVIGRAALERRAQLLLESIEMRQRFLLHEAVHQGVVQLISEVAQRPGLQEVLRVAVLRMSELFSVDRVSVVIFDDKHDVGFVVMEREQALLDNVVIRIADYPELNEVIHRQKPLIISDVFGDALLAGVRSKITQAEEPPQAAVLFPLLRKDEVVGALFLRSGQALEQVSDQLLATGRLIASVTAVAIGHALEQDMLLSERRALERSEAQAMEQLAGLQELRDFLDQAKDAMLVTDPVGVIRYANAAAAAILRQDAQCLPGWRFLDLLKEHCHGLALRALAGDPVGDEFGYVDLITHDPDNQGEVVISAAIRPLARPEGVFISFRDVTQLREIESELRQTKEFLENLIQSSVDAIIATDTDGRIILFNRAAEQVLGYSARELVGRAEVDILYARGEAADVFRKLRSEAYGGRGRLELVRKELVAKTGELVPVNLTAAVIYERNKEIATVSIFTDLRERRRIEEKLTQVQRKLQMTERQAVAIELAGAAAHELNQPLTSILGYAEMLKRRMDENDPGRKGIEVICRETERMAAIVKRIGQLTAYQTKPYVGSSQIMDIGQPAASAAAKEEEPEL